MTIEELQKIRAQQAQRRARIYKMAQEGMPNPKIAEIISKEEGKKITSSRISEIVRGEVARLSNNK